MKGLGSLISDLFTKYLGASIIGNLLRGGLPSLIPALGGAAGGLLGKTGRFLGRGILSVGGALAGTAAGKTAIQAGKELGRFGGAIGSTIGTGLKAVKTAGSSLLGKAASVMPKGSGAISGFFGKAWSSVAGAAGKLNPLGAIKTFVLKNAPKLMKALTSVPGLSAAITTLLGALDISSIRSDPNLSPDQKKEEIGKALVSILGRALGSIGGGVLGSFLPIPGLGTILGTFGGEWVGGKLAEYLGEAIGGRGIYDFMESIPGIGDLIGVTPNGEENSITPVNSPNNPSGIDSTVPNQMSPASAFVPAMEITPKIPTGAEIPSVSAQTEALKTTPPQNTSVNMPVTNVQQSNNAVIASGLSARQNSGMDAGSYFSGFRPQTAFG
jgi:hypothetical protein